MADMCPKCGAPAAYARGEYGSLERELTCPQGHAWTETDIDWQSRLSQAERERDDALARESLWKRCLIKLSLSSSFEEWQEDDPEGFAKFDRIMHDGADGDDIDLDALCTTLNVEVGDD